MTWVRLDEAFAQHPKVVKVGPLGMALHVAALCYCNTYLTDGYIPTAAARTLLDFEDYGGSKQVIKDLVNNGLWDEVADGYQLHDYHDYQPTKQQVIELRTKKQAAGQAGGKASAQAKRVAKSNPVPVPGSVSDTKPEPASVPSGKSTSPPAEDDTFATFWGGYPSRNGIKGSKRNAVAAWKTLDSSQRQLAVDALPAYAAAADGFPKDAERYLRGRLWEGLDPSQIGARAGPRDRFADMGRSLQARVDRVKEVTDGQVGAATDETRRSLPAGQRD